MKKKARGKAKRLFEKTKAGKKKCQCDESHESTNLNSKNHKSIETQAET